MNCLCAQTRQAARLLTSFYEQQLEPAGLTSAQFELLATLSAAPKMPQSELADRLAVDQTTLSRNLKLMTARRWLRPQAVPGDRRSITYQVTPAGQRTLQKAMPLWKAAQSQMQKLLGDQWSNVQSALTQLRRAASG